MPVTIVVGGQYGSEGKGKVCAYLAEKEKADIMVRCGGSNSGHTVYHNGKPVIFRHLPSGALNTNCRLLIPAGAYIDLDVLFHEIETHHIDRSRLGIDKNTVVISKEIEDREKNTDLDKKIGSTLSGTGAAVIERVSRQTEKILAGNYQELKPFITDVSEEVINGREDRKKIIIEGTQGFGLSLYHSPHYPYATSRDTTASGFASEVGISPFDVDEIVMVIRAFPIRVSGNSGPLTNEITWEQITKESQSPREILEKTSVTRKIRRVGRFDSSIVKKAISYNKPSIIFLNHIDYLHFNLFESFDKVCTSELLKKFLSEINPDLSTSISYLGFGPQISHICKNTFI